MIGNLSYLETDRKGWFVSERGTLHTYPVTGPCNVDHLNYAYYLPYTSYSEAHKMTFVKRDCHWCFPIH
jgi:hypothetical protein